MIPESNLPIGSCKVDRQPFMRMILGTRHSNILTLIQKYSNDIKHKVANGNKIVIWGPEVPVKRVVEDIPTQDEICSVRPPDELPISHKSKRILGQRQQ